MSLFDTGIRPLVDDYLEEEAKKVRNYGDYWSASSAGYCMRKTIFERLGVPPVEVDARQQRVFSSGHIFHEWIQGITKKSGLSIAQEVELKDEHFMIRGHFDDLVLVDGHLILYDFKTAHSKWFEYAKDQPISHYHRMQLGTYMMMLRHNGSIGITLEGQYWQKIENLTEARILKISKDDLRMDEKQLMWSEALEKDVTDYWTEINKYWKARKIPECTCGLYEVNKKTGKGFMADPRYNQYYYEGEPCSLQWYKEWRLEKELAEGKAV